MLISSKTYVLGLFATLLTALALASSSSGKDINPAGYGDGGVSRNAAVARAKDKLIATSRELPRGYLSTN
jgi:hypothetical protein